MKNRKKRFIKILKKIWGIIQIAWNIYNYISMIIEIIKMFS